MAGKKPKAGRPPRHAGEHLTKNRTFRVWDKLDDQLQAAAQQSRRTVSAEIEYRLEYSFRIDDLEPPTRALLGWASQTRSRFHLQNLVSPMRSGLSVGPKGSQKDLPTLISTPPTCRRPRPTSRRSNHGQLRRTGGAPRNAKATRRARRHFRASGASPHPDPSARACHDRLPGSYSRRRVRALSRSKEGTPCHDETRDRGFAGSTSASASTSPGPNRAAAASARLARQTANKLKSCSRNGCSARGRRAGPSDPAAVLVTDVLNEYLQRAGAEGRGTGAHRLCGARAHRFLRGQQRRRCDAADMRALRREARALGRHCAARTGVLRAAINYAHKNGRITRPVAVELPERPEPRDRWLTRKEAARLIRAARTPQARLYMPLFILIGLYTGRRKEAILSLRWPQVNLEAGTINFEVPGRRRTNKKRGVVTIPPRLLPHLRRARKRGTDLGYVLHIDGERIWRHQERLCRRMRARGHRGRLAPHLEAHGGDMADAGRHRPVAGGRLPFDRCRDIVARLRSPPSRLPARGGREHRRRPQNVRVIA